MDSVRFTWLLFSPTWYFPSFLPSVGTTFTSIFSLYVFPASTLKFFRYHHLSIPLAVMNAGVNFLLTSCHSFVVVSFHTAVFVAMLLLAGSNSCVNIKSLFVPWKLVVMFFQHQNVFVASV